MTPDADPQTVDLAQYPDLVVMIFGMRARNLQGIATTLSFRRKIAQTVKKLPPEGLLHLHFMILSIAPLHFALRTYWKSFEDMEKWARKSEHHIQWWQGFFKDARGVGIWHETYCLQGGIEAVYNDMPEGVGLTTFAPNVQARGKYRTAKGRLGATREFLSGTNT